jgi:hypothetical protein
MEVEILKDKWCEMKKLVKNREIQHSSQSWYIRNTLSMLPNQDKKRNTSSINELCEIAKED